MFAPFRLKKTIGESYSMDLEDALNAKRALAALGHLEEPEDGFDEYPDRPMIEAVRSFQRASGLAEDGVMKPDGPTLERLNETLAARQVPAATPSAPSLGLLAGDVDDPLRHHRASLLARQGGGPIQPKRPPTNPGAQVAMARRRQPWENQLGFEGGWMLNQFVGGGGGGRLSLGRSARTAAGPVTAGGVGAGAAELLKGNPPGRDEKPAVTPRLDIMPPPPPLPGFEPPKEKLPNRMENIPPEIRKELKETYPAIEELDLILEGFPDQRNELPQILILLAGSRGSPPIEERNNFLLDRMLEKLKEMDIPSKHTGGGTSKDAGYRPEHYFKKKAGIPARRSDGRIEVGPTLEGLFLEDFQTVDTLVDGETMTKREGDAARDIRLHKEKNRERGGVTTYAKHPAMPIDRWKEIMGPRVDAYVEATFGRFRRK